jgi:ankyrin repeat protein
VIAYLVSRGSNINVRNNYGITPLIAVAGTSRLDSVSFLVEKGADINDRGNIIN